MLIATTKIFLLVLALKAGSSRAECSKNWFDCGNGKCVSEIWRCDGDNDCGNLKDEENCEDLLVSEDCTHFTCVSNKLRIPKEWRCDGEVDCVDGSDEIQCKDPCENATCSHKCRPTPAGPECYCNDGYILDARDNKTCSDIDECQQEGFCSHECTNTAGSYNCSCKSGYELVNRTCKAKGSDPLLVFATLHEIRAMYLRSQEYLSIRRAFANASAVDFCPKYKRVYWLEMSNKSSIYSVKNDGSDFRTVLDTGLVVPEDIAVDYIAGNLYITDSGLKQVLVCKIDGSKCSALHDEDVGKPRSIVLDHAEGFVYWSDCGEHTAGIYRSGMDGSHRIPLVSSDIAWPNGIAIDRSTSRLYWADAKLHRIEYISLDGNFRKVIYNETLFHPYAVTVFEDTIYWSDWSKFSLESCNKFTGHDVKVLLRENSTHIMGVHVYHPLLMATVPNPCRYHECRHMCLISPVSGFRCACSYGFQLEKDGKTCKIEERSESLFVTEGSNIFHIIPKAVGSGTITKIPLQMPNAIIRKVSYDRNLHRLFVADINKPEIIAVNISPLRTRVLARSHMLLPQDLAFDSRSNNLYWVDTRIKTLEVISIDSLKRVVLIKNLKSPVSLAISPEKGIMFIATIDETPSIIKCDMDGSNRIVLQSVGMPVSLALHPSKTTLYWADQSSGTITSIDYDNLRFRILVRGAYDIWSVAASEDYIYWTTHRRELNLHKANVTHVLQLPGQGKASLIKRVTYSPAALPAGKSECLTGNGGCSYLCLTSPRGRTCACPSELMLDLDNVSCVDFHTKCERNMYQCRDGICLRKFFVCDGDIDCKGGEDEQYCFNTICKPGDFLCSDNKRCISKYGICDGYPDCRDGSDEVNCNQSRTTQKPKQTLPLAGKR